MLKDILVHIPIEGPVAPVVDCAISLATSFQANLTAVAFDYQILDGSTELHGDIAGGAAESITGTEQALAALDKFAIAAKKSGISHGVRKIDVSLQAGETLATVSRLYDLTIIGQHDSAKSGYDEDLGEAVLLKSGRPILLVPYTFSGPLQIKRALICWDGSKAAARATYDAMPFLRVAESLKIMGLNEGDPDTLGISSKALAEHLARHQLLADVVRFDVSAADIQSAILSTAADYDADIIIMGGYGHPRIREYIWGGVTRETFESLTIPVLMSH